MSVPGEQVLRAVQPIRDEDVVLGQYEGYKDDPTVPKDSVTPTFASIILHINNERWDGRMQLSSDCSSLVVFQQKDFIIAGELHSNRILVLDIC